MERKGGITAVVSEEEVTTALSRTTTVTSEEEKTLRMRYGAKVSTTAPLERAYGKSEALADELMVIEMQLFRAMRARMQKAQAAMAPKNPAKDKIVRALRKRKPS